MSEYLNIGLDITGLLDNSPTYGKGPALIMCRGIEYMPVRHGHWKILRPRSLRLDRRDSLFECSVCGMNRIRRTGEVVNYCPYCGSKMDGKDQGDKEYEDSILAAQKSEE